MARTNTPINKPPPRKSGKQPRMSFVWMALGLTIGLFVAFLVYIQQTYRSPVRAPDSASLADTPPSTPGTETGKPRFEFYHMLPEMEVVVPRDRKPESAPNATPKPTKPAPSANTPAIQYVLQAGAFRTQAEADKRRANLALLGVESTIHASTREQDGTWYRVQIGPSQDIKKLNGVRELLENNRVQTMLLHYKG